MNLKKCTPLNTIHVAPPQIAKSIDLDERAINESHLSLFQMPLVTHSSILRISSLVEEWQLLDRIHLPACVCFQRFQTAIGRSWTISFELFANICLNAWR